MRLANYLRLPHSYLDLLILRNGRNLAINLRMFSSIYKLFFKPVFDL